MGACLACGACVARQRNPKKAIVTCYGLACNFPLSVSIIGADNNAGSSSSPFSHAHSNTSSSRQPSQLLHNHCLNITPPAIAALLFVLSYFIPTKSAQNLPRMHFSTILSAVLAASPLIVSARGTLGFALGARNPGNFLDFQDFVLQN